MNAKESTPTEPAHDRVEQALRQQRAAMFFVLFTFIALGGIVIASVFWPEGTLSRVLPSTIPVAIVPLFAIFFFIIRRHGQPLRPDAPEIKRLQRDEWYRASMSRASRGALVVVLAAQVPLALLLIHLPTVRAVWEMVGLTVTLGMAAQIALFLFFDRE
jgi:hypothetical protein